MEPKIIRMIPFKEPSQNNLEHRNLARFDFEHGGIHVFGNLLRQTASGELFFTTARMSVAPRLRPVKVKDPKLTQSILSAAVTAYFKEGGEHIDPDHVAQHGYSMRIGVDGFPLDPRHPFNCESAA